MLREMSLKTISIILAVLIVLGLCGVAAVNYIPEDAFEKTETYSTTVTKSTTKSKETITETETPVITFTTKEVLVSHIFVNSNNSNQSYTFDSNGTCYETFKGVQYTGKWSIEGGYLIIHDDANNSDKSFSLEFDKTGYLISFVSTTNSDTYTFS